MMTVKKAITAMDVNQLYIIPATIDNAIVIIIPIMRIAIFSFSSLATWALYGYKYLLALLTVFSNAR